MIEGSVDLVTAQGAVGWLGDKVGGDPLEVVAFLGERIIGEAVASALRPDLAHVGFNGGLCGFEMVFANRIAESDLAFLTFCPKGSQLQIPRSSPEAYFDALQAITGTFPASGRNRSIYGGLWTDRTDALQILAGRAKAKLYDPSIIRPLRALLADGLVEMPADTERPLAEGLAHVFAAANVTEGDLKPACAALAAYAFAPPTVALMKAAFDDTPILYRPQMVDAEAAFMQAAAFEAFTSPAEMLVAYIALREDGARLDYVFDSHELPEFSADGASRWAPRGAAAVAGRLESLKRPVRSHDLTPGSVVLVSPGLIHRVVCDQGAAPMRVVLSPQRVSPIRFSQEEWGDLVVSPELKGRL